MFSSVLKRFLLMTLLVLGLIYTSPNHCYQNPRKLWQLLATYGEKKTIHSIRACSSSTTNDSAVCRKKSFLYINLIIRKKKLKLPDATEGRNLIFDISVNCNCVDTRWQQYSTHLHTNNTQNDTQNKQYIEQRKNFGISCSRMCLFY
jgi:hypothetical protein